MKGLQESKQQTTKIVSFVKMTENLPVLSPLKIIKMFEFLYSLN